MGAAVRVGGTCGEIGDDVIVELAPEGPQRGDLADDIAAALEANPAAAAFFDTLAQFYRKGWNCCVSKHALDSKHMFDIVDLHCEYDAVGARRASA